MDFESDEMFKLLKFKMSDWATAARIAQVAAAAAQSSGAQATMATKNKPAPNAKKEAKPEAAGAK